MPVPACVPACVSFFCPCLADAAHKSIECLSRGVEDGRGSREGGGEQQRCGCCFSILALKSGLPQRHSLVYPMADLHCVSPALIAPWKAPLCLDSSWHVCAGRRNFAHFIAGYAEPKQAQYVGVDTGRILGQCSNLSAVTWGQGAAIGGHPYRSVLQQHGAKLH